MNAFVSALSTTETVTQQQREIVESSLKQFITEYSDTLTVVSAGITTESIKKVWIDSLLKLLDSDPTNAWSLDVTALGLQVLRILLRESCGCDAVYTEKVMHLMATHAHLNSVMSDSSIPFYQDRVAIEALKCLSNMLLQNPSIRQLFSASDLVAAAAKSLEIQSLDMGTVFLLSRLIFLGTVESKAVATSLVSLGICDSLAHYLDNITKGKLLLGATETWISIPVTVNEILKTGFSLSVPISESYMTNTSSMPVLFGGTKSLGDALSDHAARDELGKSFTLLLAATIEIFTKTPLNPIPLTPPHSHAINMMMNLPVKSLSKTWFFEDDYSIVYKSVDILTTTLCTVFPQRANINSGKGRKEYEDEEEYLAEIDGTNVDQAIPPLLILMRSWAKGDDGACQILKKLLMPKNIDRSKPLHHGTTVTNYMIWLMMTVTMLQIRDCVSELLFAVCKESMDELVAYVGYGNAAGFLMNKGLLGSTPSQSKPSQEESVADDQAKINPITGEYIKPEDEHNEALENMTEEERERETEKLMVLISRLEKNGAIQVVRKNEA
ncbi:hypothetical protein BDV3_006531 [Batrachochytrium dendrobatidis]